MYVETNNLYVIPSLPDVHTLVRAICLSLWNQTFTCNAMAAQYERIFKQIRKDSSATRVLYIRLGFVNP